MARAIMRIFITVAMSQSNSIPIGIAQMQRSAELMNTDTIDLMQVHNLRDTAIHMRTIRDWQAADAELGQRDPLAGADDHGRGVGVQAHVKCSSR